MLTKVSDHPEQGHRQAYTLYSDRVVFPGGVSPATIFVKAGIIQSVQPGPYVASDREKHFDFSGLVIAPGIVDAHVHINEPGRTSWEGFVTATKAAAAGGVTTLIDMPLNSSPVTTTPDALSKKQASASKQLSFNDQQSDKDVHSNSILVDVGFHGGLIPGNAPEIAGLVRAGVLGVKAFLCDSGLAEFPAASQSDLRCGLEALRWTGVPLLVHAEVTDAAVPLKTDDPSSYRQYAASRPPQFELRAIEQMIKLCRETEVPVHIVHLAAAEAIPMIEAALAEGLPLSVETCPHYLYFADDMISDGDTRFKCAPPIRNAANRRRLRQAVQDNIISTIGSDHSPCDPELKHLKSGNLEKAWGGISSLQLTLNVMLKIARQESWSLPMLFDRLSRQPAQRFLLGDRKGQIAPGFDADFVIFDPEAEMTVTAEDLHHRHPVTPYDRQLLTGRVHTTILRGRCVFKQQPDGEPDFARHPTGSMSFDDNRLTEFLISLQPDARRKALTGCCGSEAWVDRMMDLEFHRSDRPMFARARKAWSQLEEADYLEAFAAHPQIGDVKTLAAKYRDTLHAATHEQQRVAEADNETIAALANDNQKYLNKFGFIFIVFATGKTAEEMLMLLQCRLNNDRDTEIRNAAREQLKITLLRLSQLKPRHKTTRTESRQS